MKLESKRKPAAPVERTRLVSRRGTFRVTRIGEQRTGWRDPYHKMLTLSWPRFLGLMSGIYLAANAVFGGLYWIDKGAIGGIDDPTYLDGFFFSIQTMGTIGYGVMHPVSLWANILVTIETLVAVFTVAVVAGLMFARFSRPTARVMFSTHAVVSPFDGVPTFRFRAANQRHNQIFEAQVTCSVLRSEHTVEGYPIRRFYDLELARKRNPIFAISWTVMHPIDERSPLYGMSIEAMIEADIEIVVVITGIDETFSTAIHSRYSYKVEDIRWNHRLVDILSRDSGGRVTIDYGRFHETVATEAVEGQSREGLGNERAE